MDNQHRKINGYRELTQQEIDLMNKITAKGEELKLLIEEANQTYIDPETNYMIAPFDDNQDFIDIAKRHFQQGLMALKRAVAKPDFF